MDLEPLRGVAGRPGLTHIALKCRDTLATAAFYEAVCGMSLVHQRTGEAQPVVWVSARPLGLDFVLVLMGGGGDGKAPRMDHLGFTVASREVVDAIAAAAAEIGALAEGPHDLGPPVGYFVVIRDPDGNGVEFSHGQEIRF
ncbi:MAG: VOC family protein [Planctomycetes bacterium]|nr:VOC family protein [Planctomycetota bacterium]MCW8136171.1 VOC family protein [Planctomycetota bacterium]